MKYLNLTMILLLLCSTTLFAQKKVQANITQLIDRHTTFQSTMPLVLNEKGNAGNDLLVSNATYAQLNTHVSQSVSQNKPEYLELSIPYGNTTITMLLYRVEIIAENFHIATDKQNNVAYNPGAYYRGIIKEDPNSIASISFFDKEIYGIVSAQGLGNVVIGKLNTPRNIEDYIIYSDLNLAVPSLLSCTTSDSSLPQNSLPHKNSMDTQSEHCVSLYFELRHNAYQANDNNVSQTVDWFTALFNNVQTLFDNDGISTALKSVYVWEGEDPYDLASSNAYDLLDQFAAQTPVFDADAGQLIHYGGGMGLAYDIGALCSGFNRSFAMVNPYYQPLPAFSYAVKIIAHELGHTLGSQHTHGCYWNGNNTAIDGCASPEGDCQPGPMPTEAEGGTIMSYCGNINFANGFGAQPAARILQHIATSQCLGTDCINSCINTISALYLTETSPTTATLTWEDAEAGTWEVGFATYGSDITNWQEVNDSTFTVEGLLSNTYYTFSVRKLCTAGTSPSGKTLVFCSEADWCGGTVWTDTGGENGNYLTNQHTVTIIKPTVPGQAVSVTFQDFFTQVQDVLYVYNGIGTSAPLLGSWSGYIAPAEPFIANNPSGALTFEFIADVSTAPSDGWVAVVECATMGLDEQTFANLSYFPNPVTEMLNLSLPTGLSDIAVYNIAGQLLAQNKVDSTSYSIDLRSFAPGLYLLKVSSGRSVSFIKVLKQ